MKRTRYVALSGGVGGAKLVLGLAQVLPPHSLTVAANVGDDFEHFGLLVCPDLDTVLYTLSGVVHADQGWGRADESFKVLDEIRRLGGASWFTLGDRDIALHLIRREMLRAGRTLSEISVELARRLGVDITVVPVTNDVVRTSVMTDRGFLPFQDYFVRLRCEPRILSLDFEGASGASLSPPLRDALDSNELAGVVLCPSNPYLSIAPMLAVNELRERLRSLTVPVLAVSPIVAGEAIKGPTAKIMRELGVTPTAGVIADLYEDFVDVIVVDNSDASLASADQRFVVAPTVMKTNEDKVALARRCLEFIETRVKRA